MQTPQVAGPLSRGKLGYLIVLVSSAIAAISFFAFPYSVSNNTSGYGLTNQGTTSTTLFQITQRAAPIERLATLYTIDNAITWTIFIFPVVCFIISLLLVLLPTPRIITTSSGISFIVMGSMQIAHIGAGILTYNASTLGTASIGVGGWFCFLGMLPVLIGGIIVTMTRPLGTVASGYGYGAVYPPQPPVSYGQYPPNASFPNFVQYPPQSSIPNFAQYPPQPSAPNNPPPPQQP